MSGEVRLGLRLARGQRSAERLRSVGAGLAHLLGVWTMLIVVSAVRAEIALPSYDGDALPLFVLTVVATIGVPVAVLLATMARLSAALRDRRLASLRVLGLSAGRTRVVAAVEAGAAAVVGSVVGVVLFWLTRPMVRGVDVAGRDWSSAPFAPWWWTVPLFVIALPLVAVAVALVPGARPASTLSARPALVSAVRAPSLWRLLPLPVGLASVGLSTIGLDSDGGVGDARLVALVGGGIVTAIGLILVIPVLTCLIAELLVRVQGGPALRIAGRRLQSQPADVSRIVAGLLIGLFVVAGGRMVIGAWESTPQYQAADRAAHGGQVAYDVYVDPSSGADSMAAALTSVEGVRTAYPQWQLMTDCGVGGPCLSAFVGTCADLEASIPDATGCRDGRAAWLDRVGTEAGARPGSTIEWSTGTDETGRPVAALPAPAGESVIRSDASDYAVSDAMQAQIFIPAGTPGVTAVLDEIATDTAVPVAVEVDAGTLGKRDLAAVVRTIDPMADLVNPWGGDDYAFVAGLRSLVWAVTAVVLAIGLVGFAISTIDRTVSRRAEMVSLQLVGTGRGVIRVAQWWEAAVPLTLGVLLAIATGSAVGLGYLSMAEDLDAVPWGSIGALAAVSVVAAVGVAGVTVAACAPRIRADLIRRA